MYYCLAYNKKKDLEVKMLLHDQETPVRNLNVTYYVPDKSSDLYRYIITYNDQCAKFVSDVEELVAKYGADSAVSMRGYFGVITVSGLNFSYKNAPLFWNVNKSGDFTPHINDEAYKDFYILIPDFKDFYTDAPEGVMIGKLGETIVVSVTPNKDGTPCVLKGCTFLDEEAIEKLKATATPQEIEHFESLSRTDWEPLPLSLSEAFKVSSELKPEITERQNAMRKGGLEALFNASSTGFVLKRIGSVLNSARDFFFK